MQALWTVVCRSEWNHITEELVGPGYIILFHSLSGRTADLRSQTPSVSCS